LEFEEGPGCGLFVASGAMLLLRFAGFVALIPGEFGVAEPGISIILVEIQYKFIYSVRGMILFTVQFVEITSQCK
jgi:hypothetical protein